MPAYTPGPWLVQAERDGTFTVWTRQPYTGSLATVIDEDINGPYPAKANARLIAAAPELLDALLALLEHGVSVAGEQAVAAVMKARE